MLFSLYKQDIDIFDEAVMRTLRAIDGEVGSVDPSLARIRTMLDLDHIQLHPLLYSRSAVTRLMRLSDTLAMPFVGLSGNTTIDVVIGNRGEAHGVASTTIRTN